MECGRKRLYVPTVVSSPKRRSLSSNAGVPTAASEEDQEHIFVNGALEGVIRGDTNFDKDDILTQNKHDHCIPIESNSRDIACDATGDTTFEVFTTGDEAFPEEANFGGTSVENEHRNKDSIDENENYSHPDEPFAHCGQKGPFRSCYCNYGAVEGIPDKSRLEDPKFNADDVSSAAPAARASDPGRRRSVRGDGSCCRLAVSAPGALGGRRVPVSRSPSPRVSGVSSPIASIEGGAVASSNGLASSIYHKEEDPAREGPCAETASPGYGEPLQESAQRSRVKLLEDMGSEEGSECLRPPPALVGLGLGHCGSDFSSVEHEERWAAVEEETPSLGPPVTGALRRLQNLQLALAAAWETHAKETESFQRAMCRLFHSRDRVLSRLRATMLETQALLDSQSLLPEDGFSEAEFSPTGQPRSNHDFWQLPNTHARTASDDNLPQFSPSHKIWQDTQSPSSLQARPFKPFSLSLNSHENHPSLSHVWSSGEEIAEDRRSETERCLWAVNPEMKDGADPATNMKETQWYNNDDSESNRFNRTESYDEQGEESISLASQTAPGPPADEFSDSGDQEAAHLPPQTGTPRTSIARKLTSASKTAAWPLRSRTTWAEWQDEEAEQSSTGDGSTAGDVDGDGSTVGDGSVRGEGASIETTEDVPAADPGGNSTHPGNGLPDSLLGDRDGRDS
eukprot:Gregarina_sp_Poly_1__237@NODE_1055_length_5215_cov_77_719891_g733_i0_p1_GENE_NODE_1055_length_5215_cov_77_719891_g733_i0NODE_1055_length_5215_cov_77_719891_g733_i0_p1_ORF_typecomplete_len682_score132_47VCBS/PF13517_6/0_18DUF2884/PF11101_8/0_16_NODE_1055_length_5215_cov_77_719891_g733_i027504795